MLNLQININNFTSKFQFKVNVFKKNIYYVLLCFRLNFYLITIKKYILTCNIF